VRAFSFVLPGSFYSLLLPRVKFPYLKSTFNSYYSDFIELINWRKFF
jgi:hypothetical protein